MKKNNIPLIMLTIVLELLSILFESTIISFIGIMFLWGIGLAYAYSDLKKRMLLFMFLLTFFTFLLSRKTVQLLFAWQDFFSYSNAVMEKSFHLIYTSLFFIIIGNYIFEIMEKRNLNIRSEKKLVKENVTLNKIQPKTILRFSFYITIIVKMVCYLEEALFVIKNGYLAYYKYFYSIIPSFIISFGNLSTFIMWIYLFTYPNKKKTKIVLFLYCISLFLSLLSGGRGDIVVGIFTIIIYLYYRQENCKERIFTKKVKIMMAIGTFAGITFLGAYNYLRNDINVDLGNQNMIKTFFYDQGSSIRVLENTIIYEDELKMMNKYYALRPFLNNNVVKYVFHIPRYNNNSIDMAFNDNNLGASITYLYDQLYYLNGGGIGTQYIAELYLEFGYLGVIIYSVILGYILGLLFNIKKEDYIMLAYSYIMIKSILFTSRNFALEYISIFLSIPMLLFSILIKILEKKGGTR